MANDAGETPAVYLRNNLRRPRSALQHEQVTSSFFTISEETKDAIYYSRCNFSNDGRIHCFDFIYPLQEKRAWDLVCHPHQRVAASYRFCKISGNSHTGGHRHNKLDDVLYSAIRNPRGIYPA